MRKKKTIFILLFLLIVILSTAYREVAARTYGYSIKSIDDGHIYFGPFGAELTEADSDALVGLKHKAMFYEKIQVPKQPLDDRSAAKLGIRLSNRNYEEWTEQNYRIVIGNLSEGGYVAILY